MIRIINLSLLMLFVFFISCNSNDDSSPDETSNDNTGNDHAGVLFEASFENGTVPYLIGNNAHPGGGRFVFVGGEINNGALNPGDGTQFYGEYNNVILDDSEEAANPSTGSKFALKTHYAAGHAFSFQKNTTIIKVPQQDVLYVRWWQKWSKNWVWPSDQQKLIKIKGPDVSQNFPVTGGLNVIHLTYSPNGEGQKYVYSKWSGDETDYRGGDSVPDNDNFLLETNRWYCIEVMVQLNTPNQSDGEYNYWIDGDLKLRLTGVNNRGSVTTGVETIEMQHVYQDNNPPQVGIPTWIGDIVISTQRIGCGNTAN